MAPSLFKINAMPTKPKKKTARTVIKKATKVKKPLPKTTAVVVPASRGVSAGSSVSRLTKEMLNKRQAAKGPVRKQGGPKLAELTEKKLRGLSHQMEAGPTRAE